MAPEAGSDRLRRFINKKLSEDDILNGSVLLAQAGIKRLKLYFMLGLPSETDEDARAAGELVRKIADRLKDAVGKSAPQLTLSLSTFVPKPFTPFQWSPMAPLVVLKARAGIIRGLLKKTPVRMHFDPPKWAFLQTLLSRGDRRAGQLVEALERHGGKLTPALKEIDFDPDEFVFQEWDKDHPLPWSFIDHGLNEGFLQEEWGRAEKGRATPDCRPAECRLCGVCRPGLTAIRPF